MTTENCESFLYILVFDSINFLLPDFFLPSFFGHLFIPFYLGFFCLFFLEKAKRAGILSWLFWTI